jgi:hypothetical protein
LISKNDFPVEAAFFNRILSLRPRKLWVSEVSAAVPEVSAAVCVSSVPGVVSGLRPSWSAFRDSHESSRHLKRRSFHSLGGER